MLKVGITGGTGMLGTYLIREILKRGNYIPIIISRNKVTSLNGIELRVTDYSLDSLFSVFQDLDSIIHLASIRGNKSNIIDYVENEVVTQSVYLACIKLGIENVVYSSSIAVYSDMTLLPWNEDTPLCPSTLYGVSKVCCEFLGKYYSKGSVLRVKNLRLPPIFGIPFFDRQVERRMIANFIDRAHKKKTLVLNSNNSGRRDFLYAKNAVHAILCALDANNLIGEFNIGSGESFTNIEVAKEINNVFDNVDNLIVEQMDESLIHSSFMSFEKARRELGYEPEYNFVQSLIDIHNEIQGL